MRIPLHIPLVMRVRLECRQTWILMTSARARRSTGAWTWSLGARLSMPLPWRRSVLGFGSTSSRRLIFAFYPRLHVSASPLCVAPATRLLACALGRSGAEERRHQLAQVYDEVARKSWAGRAARGDEDFNLATACKQVDQDLLQQVCFFMLPLHSRDVC